MTRTVPFNHEAAVYRVTLGEFVQWKYGDKMRQGYVRVISDDDSCWVDSGQPFSPDGVYFGRLVQIQCIDKTCKQCNGSENPFGHVGEQGQKWSAHYCNECQLSPVTEEISFQEVLF